MATARLHPVFDNISGKSGGMVFRRLGHDIVISRPPERRERAASPAQEAQRNRFLEAADYARRVLSDPWQRRLYEAIAAPLKRRVDKLVMSDFLTPPTVQEVDVSSYQRRAGDVVRVLATDDIEVVAVEVTIATVSGAPLESGPARKIHGVWCYSTASVPPEGERLDITAVARDRAGNEAEKTVQVN